MNNILLLLLGILKTSLASDDTCYTCAAGGVSQDNFICSIIKTQCSEEEINDPANRDVLKCVHADVDCFDEDKEEFDNNLCPYNESCGKIEIKEITPLTYKSKLKSYMVKNKWNMIRRDLNLGINALTLDKSKAAPIKFSSTGRYTFREGRDNWKEKTSTTFQLEFYGDSQTYEFNPDMTEALCIKPKYAFQLSVKIDGKQKIASKTQMFPRCIISAYCGAEAGRFIWTDNGKEINQEI